MPDNSSTAILGHVLIGPQTPPLRCFQHQGSPALPEKIKDVFGAGLLDAQYGEHPEGARPFGEGLPREVMKLVEDYDGNTYRAAYTVALSNAVYVLHVFTKKSKRGIETPRPDKDTIRARLQAAKEHHKRYYEER